MSDALSPRPSRSPASNGDEIEAYSARALDEAPRGGVVVIHHMPGYDDRRPRRSPAASPTTATTRSCRTCTGARRRARARTTRRRRRARTAASPTSAGRRRRRRHGLPQGAAATPTARSARSATAPAAASRSSPRSASTLDAAVDCYGAFVIGELPEGFPLKVDHARGQDARTCPARCSACSARRTSTRRPPHVAELEEALKANGKTYEFHSYPNAGHAFFSVNRPAYRVEAANDGWEQIFAFYGKYL